MVRPFLFRFRQQCTTRGDFDNFAYDEGLDMVVAKNKDRTPAVFSDLGMPGTKKEDMEKGEDSKDAMMWA